MATYIPQMNTQTSRNNWGQSVANNLLEAVKMNRQHEIDTNRQNMQREQLEMQKQVVLDSKDRTEKQYNVDVASIKDQTLERDYDRDVAKWKKDRSEFTNRNNKWWDFKSDKDFRQEYEDANPYPKPPDNSLLGVVEQNKVLPSRNLPIDAYSPEGRNLLEEEVLQELMLGKLIDLDD